MRIPAVLLAALLASCTGSDDTLVVFYAPCHSPVMDAVRGDTAFRSEIAGSQVCCRKVTELGRECDVLMLADATLFKEIASSHCTWRMEFAHDRLVLGVGIRAKRTDDAEKDWVPVLLDENVSLGRVDENLGPIGYRTLLAWDLKEGRGHAGLAAKLRAKCGKVVEHASQLATLLKAGEIEYAFLYRTLCLKHDIRHIELEREINLGTPGVDYSAAEVSFAKLKAGAEETVTVLGAPITFGLSIPTNAPHPEKAVRFVELLLREKKDLFAEKGVTFFTPRFFGPRGDFAPFEGFAEYAGEF
ncbi:MAG: substrate-binding domain-containing protein [Planctomycetota bacterium]|jgi:molybdate/tungstate transport system substrate-binding protein